MSQRSRTIIDYATYAALNRVLLGLSSAANEVDRMDAARAIEAFIFADYVELLGREGLGDPQHRDYMNDKWRSIRDYFLQNKLFETKYVAESDWKEAYLINAIEIECNLQDDAQLQQVQENFESHFTATLATAFDWTGTAAEIVQESKIATGLFDRNHAAIIAAVLGVTETYVVELHEITLTESKLKSELKRPEGHTMQQIQKCHYISANIRGNAYRANSTYHDSGNLSCSIIRPPLFFTGETPSCSCEKTSQLAFAYGVTDYLTQLSVDDRVIALESIARRLNQDAGALKSTITNSDSLGAAEFAFESIHNSGQKFPSKRSPLFTGLSTASLLFIGSLVSQSVGEILKSPAVWGPATLAGIGAWTNESVKQAVRQAQESIQSLAPSPKKVSKPVRALIESWTQASASDQ